MRTHFRLRLLFILAVLPLIGVTDVNAADRPNVIVIMTDDQGYGDVGCYGATDLKTPAIDSLATNGIRFTQFYSGAPVCSPSRVSLLTGCYPLRTGLSNNANSQPGGPGLPTDAMTMAEIFKQHGYATGHVGKWHLGYASEMMANGQGFDYSFGHMGGCIDNYSHFFYWQGPNRHDLFLNGKEIHRPGEFFGDLVVEQSQAFIESSEGRPFFLYLALNMPHYPYQGDEKWLAEYSNLPEQRRLYNAFLSTCDERIGRVLQILEEQKLRDKTIVVFQSDNGHSLEERAFFGGGSAGPFRGEKFSMFEGGVRVPAILSVPTTISNQSGVTIDSPCHSCDWLPTLLSLCQLPQPNHELDGIDLSSLIKEGRGGDELTSRVLHWQVGEGANAQWAIRRGKWKLIGNLQTSEKASLAAEDLKLYLSNLDEDPFEKKNWAAGNPTETAELLELHRKWIADVSQSRK